MHRPASRPERAGRGRCEKCVAYGMITSDMGLLEIPHVPAPARPPICATRCARRRFPEIAPFPIHFIPGVRNFAGPVDLDNFGMMDMMRGEETEAVGLFKLLESETSAMFILPGSHNKFVAMSAEGKILGCMTSISGETARRDDPSYHFGRRGRRRVCRPGGV